MTTKWKISDRALAVLMKTDAAQTLREKLKRNAAVAPPPPPSSSFSRPPVSFKLSPPVSSKLSPPVYPFPRSEIVIDCSD